MTDYSKQYFTTVALSDGTISFYGSMPTNKVSFSKDGGETWSTPKKVKKVKVKNGYKVLWKGTLTPLYYSGIGAFDSTAQFNVEGNVMSLLFGDDFQGNTDLSGHVGAFSELFMGNLNLINAENLILPATTLARNCYRSMFNSCTHLTTAPALPATTLASYCYQQMFYHCSRLTKAPLLHAKKLADFCYAYMFTGCRSLIQTKLLFIDKKDVTHTLSMYDACVLLKYNPIIIKE